MTDQLWHLLVRIEGEWEECRFDRCSEAQTAFYGLLEDYPTELEMALLIGPDGELANLTKKSRSVVN
ncbi:MAG TPA: hypothetical protein VHZ07_21335 [Bryobacteraceae bacterium]|nr:hypothetical protein [Bryobacteraceae bacterium]